MVGDLSSRTNLRLFHPILQIDQAAIADYQKNQDNLLADVNTIMQSHPALDRFLGGNPIQMMWNNHHNHVHFIANAFKLQDGQLLVRTVVWVYKAYVAHGFHPDYFPTALHAWMQAIDNHLNPKHSVVIKAVYELLIEHHSFFVEKMQLEQHKLDTKQTDALQEHMHRLIEAMLHGDEKAALKIAKDFVDSNVHHRDFLLRVLQPALIDIGTMWEKGRINVAQEHLATAVARRIMSILYERIDYPEQERAKVVVTTAPGEYHDIGARMVSDFLEMEGYQTYFLGADAWAKNAHDVCFVVNQNFL